MYGLVPGAFGNSRWVSVALGALVGAAIGAVYFLAARPWLEGRAARRKRGLAGSFEAQLDPHGIDLLAPDGTEMHWAWADLAQLCPDREHLFFYWKDGLVTLVPRRALLGGAEQEIQELIRSKGPGSRAPGRKERGRVPDAGIVVRLERTADDLAHYAWYHNLHEPSLRMRTWLSYAVAAGGSIYASAAVVPWWAAILVGLTVTAVLPRLYFGMLKQQGAAMLRQSGSPAVRLRFDASGLTESAGESSAKVRWADVQRLEVTPRLLLIYVDRFQAVVVPRRFLGTEDEAEARLKQIAEWQTNGRSLQGRAKTKS